MNEKVTIKLIDKLVTLAKKKIDEALYNDAGCDADSSIANAIIATEVADILEAIEQVNIGGTARSLMGTTTCGELYDILESIDK